MATSDAFIAVDWGTTNRRAFLIRDGAVTLTERDARGILAVEPGGFPAELDAMRGRLGDLPVLLAGMVGSNRGWSDAGYVPCPVSLPDLAAAMHEVAPRVRIVPGVKLVAGDRADVMRGEEVQLLGAVAGGLAPRDALLCQPGTHCKWARVDDAVLTHFETAMTGELFALLKGHALIGAAMQAAATDGPAFREGVARSAQGDLLVALFGVRPASLLGRRVDADAAAYVSGLLIGSDCRAQVSPGTHVHLLADPQLGALYASAIEALGGVTTLVDSHAAFVTGITRLWELLP